MQDLTIHDLQQYIAALEALCTENDIDFSNAMDPHDDEGMPIPNDEANAGPE
jgi:hypothetical protein